MPVWRQNQGRIQLMSKAKVLISFYKHQYLEMYIYIKKLDCYICMLTIIWISGYPNFVQNNKMLIKHLKWNVKLVYIVHKNAESTQWQCVCHLVSIFNKSDINMIKIDRMPEQPGIYNFPFRSEQKPGNWSERPKI